MDAGESFGKVILLVLSVAQKLVVIQRELASNRERNPKVEQIRYTGLINGGLIRRPC
jgi:hypothetical protein